MFAENNLFASVRDTDFLQRLTENVGNELRKIG